jgi:hypothetical protein
VVKGSDFYMYVIRNLYDQSGACLTSDKVVFLFSFLITIPLVYVPLYPHSVPIKVSLEESVLCKAGLYNLGLPIWP